MSPQIGPRYVAAVKALREKFRISTTVDELVRIVLEAADAEDPLRKPNVGALACGDCDYRTDYFGTPQVHCMHAHGGLSGDAR